MKVYRLLSIINLLVNYNKLTVSQLADKLEVSKRTVYRDLDSLTMAGIPIVSYSGYNGGISICEDYILNKNVLSTNDIKNILIGLRGILSIGEAKEIKYLISRLIPKELHNINEESDIIIDFSNWYNDDFSQKLVNSLRKAIANQQYVHLTYYSRSIVTKRKIEPYKLVFKESDWYLYGYCLTREDFRLFKLTRISSYKILNDTFKRKRNIKIGKLCCFPIKKQNINPDSIKWWIRLECNIEYKEFIIEKFSAENLKWINNKLLLEFTSNNLEHIADLVISLQNKVKVIEPLELQNLVINKIENIYKIYEG